MPAHATILYPFKPIERASDSDIRRGGGLAASTYDNGTFVIPSGQTALTKFVAGTPLRSLVVVE